MFESIQPAPPDPILGLTEAFKEDSNPGKINLGVGVYKDAEGNTPILETVKEAERRLIDSEKSKAYKPIPGDARYAELVRELIFGRDSAITAEDRARTAHTPGGTGALRVAGDYLHKLHPDVAIWVSDPTWSNHLSIFPAAGMEVKKYPYLDRSSNTLDFEAMIDALGRIPAGDVALLHGCCHNPAGADPTLEQWERIADVLAERGVLPLVDFAYQGFGEGLERDAEGLRLLAGKVDELIVCSSFSKNFGLYNERAGALTLVAGRPEHVSAVFSQVKKSIRANYSNPPAHGGHIVQTILDDPELRERWDGEVAGMRDRINRMRRLFVDTLKAKGVDGDFSFIRQQNGMFSFSGLNAGQVERLRGEHSIYIVGSGRINVAGMTESNMDRLCDAIAGVLRPA